MKLYWIFSYSWLLNIVSRKSLIAIRSKVRGRLYLRPVGLRWDQRGRLQRHPALHPGRPLRRAGVEVGHPVEDRDHADDRELRAQGRETGQLPAPARSGQVRQDSGATDARPVGPHEAAEAEVDHGRVGAGGNEVWDKSFALRYFAAVVWYETSEKFYSKDVLIKIYD